MSAIYTQLRRHKDAITHAKSSIIILRKIIEQKEKEWKNEQLNKHDPII